MINFDHDALLALQLWCPSMTMTGLSDKRLDKGLDKGLDKRLDTNRCSLDHHYKQIVGFHNKADVTPV